MRGICMDVRDESTGGGLGVGVRIHNSFAGVSFTRLRLMEMRLY